MRIAQILYNKVHWVFETDEMPRFAPDIVLVDITSITPAPQEGWECNAGTGVFSAPSPPASPRIISKFEFASRFTPEERVAVRNAGKTDSSVEDYIELSNIVDEVDLDNPMLAAGFAMLVSKSLLTQARATAILG